VAVPVSARRVDVGVNSWWRAFPASDPLDTIAAERATKREHRMKNPLFLACCELAGIPATSRQARKFNQRKGLATRYYNEAKSLL
jgi:hypothetical protein